jgi:hypothetical protein
VTRDELALAHHRWHCTHEIELGACVADQQDYDFADFAMGAAS